MANPEHSPAPATCPSLPLDLVKPIADLLLADDAVEFLRFRAVCHQWRSLTPDPRNLASCFRPRHWIMLSDGGADLTAHLSFLHTSHGRSLQLLLPDLYGRSILSVSDGLLILHKKDTSAVCLLNPFTRYLTDLPPISADTLVYRDSDRLSSFPLVSASVSPSSGTDLPTVMLCFHPWSIAFAKPGDERWTYISQPISFCSSLFFQGQLHVSNSWGKIKTIELENNTINTIIDQERDDTVSRSYLVECNSEMLLVRKYSIARYNGALAEVFKIDLESNSLVPVKSIGEFALFVGPTRTISVSSKDFPSVRSNSIYFGTDLLSDPVVIYNIEDHHCEAISERTVIYNGVKRIRRSVRPFTLADHLITYCSHLHWAHGLMYHEFSVLPRRWNIQDFIWGITPGFYLF